MNPRNRDDRNPFTRDLFVNMLDRDEFSSYQEMYRHFIWGEAPLPIPADSIDPSASIAESVHVDSSDPKKNQSEDNESTQKNADSPQE